MSDIVFESIRAFVLAILVAYLWKVGKRRGFAQSRGWRQVEFGFYLLLFAAVLDITDNFHSLNIYVAIGNTEMEAFLEKVVGYLGGFILVALGLIRWAPTVEQVHLAHARLETAVAERTTELERSNRDLEQFAYLASHDLQEPVRTISTYLQRLEKREGERLDADSRASIGLMLGAAKRMRALIRDLLDYSRIERRGKPLEPMDSAAAVKVALADLNGQVSETRSDIAVSPLPTVLGDPLQIAVVFRNLLSNAIKYRHPDRRPEIRVGAERRDGQWEFLVEDNGIGIESQYLDRIFDIFERLHRDDEYEGTGIGLAICEKIVGRHGGTVWAESVPGKGSIFHFRLRAAD